MTGSPPPPPPAPASPSPAPERASLLDGVRFAFGTLTVLPARITRWDRPAARTGMVCAPLAGLVVGLCAAALGTALVLLSAGPLLAAVATVAVPAALTRGLHLDGLADTADGLGSAKPAETALRIMKQSDIGPFGVITLLLVLLAQVAALYDLYAGGWAPGALAAVTAAVTARLAMTLAARSGVPAARPGGLGAAVAGVVPVPAAAALAVLTALAAAAAALPLGLPAAAQHAGAVLAGLAAAELLLRRCVRRLDGVTGDVFGAVEETAATCALVVLALG
ncbi:adenosylcobinamide-GDP ribazoletransferase [Streptomyces sp. NPDC090022]|uniref:adenosylcobinamide-GDP ribazoletransferase n=1 Tax=Streptomyces sp. NPDC090022 TaxID=3365920 RepID=UPI003804294C